eukprot:4313276-Amphidinium_carterae.1
MLTTSTFFVFVATVLPNKSCSCASSARDKTSSREGENDTDNTFLAFFRKVQHVLLCSHNTKRKIRSESREGLPHRVRQTPDW